MARWLRHVPRPEAVAAMVSVTVGVALLLIKFGAYFVTGSTVIFADALESIVNVAAAVFAGYALNLAHRPADKDHPYGHGKVEFLSAGFEGGMILLAAVISIGKALSSLFHAQSLHVDQLWLGAVLMAVALVANASIGAYLVRVGKIRVSLTLEADGQHLITDAITSAVALVTLLIVKYTGHAWADPFGAILVSLYIGMTGMRLLRRSTAGLMDEQDIADATVLRQILDSHVGPTGAQPQICSYHKLRHRHTGRYHWVDFHIMVPSIWSVQQGHEVASAIEYQIEQTLGEGNATAHIEPCLDAGCSTCDAYRPAAVADV